MAEGFRTGLLAVMIEGLGLIAGSMGMGCLGFGGVGEAGKRFGMVGVGEVRMGGTRNC